MAESKHMSITLGPIGTRILVGVASAIIGAALMILLTATGDHGQVTQNTKAVESMQRQIQVLQSTGASRTDIDHLRNEMQESLRDLNGKMDNVITLLIKQNGK